MQTKRGNSGTLKSDYFKIKYTVGESGNLIHCCKKQFGQFFNIGTTTIDHLIAEIKQGISITLPPLNDHSVVAPTIINKLKIFAENCCIELSHEQKGRMVIEHSEAVLTCSAWLWGWFKICGDTTPNRAGEIHLERQPKTDIYNEYVTDKTITEPGVKVLSYQNFCLLWRNRYSFVKIREKKQIGGKCNTCCDLSFERRSSRSRDVRDEITMCHAFHRTMYMGEREMYYARREHAVSSPMQAMSTIGDGMAQAHCCLPWHGNQKSSAETLGIHIQGVIEHGQEFVAYITYDNVKPDSNLAIHTMLLQWERRYLRKGILPDTLYHQVDGGAENANQDTLIICELMIIRGLTKKIILTRLPAGHTHEDIDAKFGVIWKNFFDRYILTPQGYFDGLVSSFRKTDTPTVVQEIWAVPDYKSYLLSFRDKKFERFAKEDWTQLQWIFQAVERCEQFPNGCKTTYRAYAADTVIEIRDGTSVDWVLANKPSLKTDFIPIQLTVNEFPKASPSRPLGGLYLLLKTVPSGPLRVASYKEGARSQLDKVISYFIKDYGDKYPQAVTSWQNWAASNAPKCDDAEVYVKWKTLHVPLYDQLFKPPSSISQFIPRTLSVPRSVFNNATLLQGLTMGSVSWSGTKDDSSVLTHSATGRRQCGPKKIVPARTMVADVRLQSDKFTAKTDLRKKRKANANGLENNLENELENGDSGDSELSIPVDLGSRQLNNGGGNKALKRVKGGGRAPVVACRTVSINQITAGNNMIISNAIVNESELTRSIASGSGRLNKNGPCKGVTVKGKATGGQSLKKRKAADLSDSDYSDSDL